MQCYVDVTTLVLDGERPEADLVVSHSLAAAANYLQSSLSSSSHDKVNVQFMVRPATAQGEGEAWERKTKDQFLLCMDRSVTRIYPSLDPAQYLRDPVQFIVGKRGTAHYLMASVTLYTAQEMATVSVTLLPLKEARYYVEGAYMEPSSLQWEAVASLGTDPSERNPVLSTGEDPAEERITAEDDDLWRRARAANTHYVSEAFATNAVAAMNVHVERRQRFLWRLSRWCAERFLNESNWARPLETESQRAGGPKGAHKFHTQRLSKSTINFLSAYQPTYRSILDAIVAAGGRQRTKRLGHADGRGMEIDAVLLAATPRYGYVGVPVATSVASSSPSGESSTTITTTTTTAAPSWYLIARIPLPSWCASETPGEAKTKKRSREDAGRGDHNTAGILNFSEVVPYTSERRQLRLLAPGERAGVTVRSHRVYCKDQGRAEKQAVTPHNTSICFDDSYVTQRYTLHTAREGEGAEAAATCEANTFHDVITLVNESCNRFLATRLKFTETVEKALRVVGASKQESDKVDEKVEASAQTEEEEKLDAETILPQAQLLKLTESLYNEVTDTFSVHFKKVRDKKALSQIPQVNTVKDLEALSEGCTVEFKYRVDTPDKNELASSAEPEAVAGGSAAKEAMGRVNTERLRHTIAGMASLHGGVIAVGVRDDGKVVGHPTGEVVRALRDSSFCPAMVVHSVSVKELRLAAAAMPKEWWQKAKAAPSLRVPPVAGGKEGAEAEQTTASDSVVTVITIMKGQAPFYASGRTALPYQRGAASTTPMTMHNMIVRLFAVLMERAPSLS